MRGAPSLAGARNPALDLLVYLRFPEGVTLPGAAVPGVCVLRSASMKKKWSGGAAQRNCVLSAALLTLVMRNSNSVPDPFSGAKSFEKANMRSVLIGPVPGRTFPATFQLPPVTPAFAPAGSGR